MFSFRFLLFPAQIIPARALHLIYIKRSVVFYIENCCLRVLSFVPSSENFIGARVFLVPRRGISVPRPGTSVPRSGTQVPRPGTTFLPRYRNKYPVYLHHLVSCTISFSFRLANSRLPLKMTVRFLSRISMRGYVCMSQSFSIGLSSPMA